MGFIDKMNEKSSYSVASGNVLNMLFYRLLWKNFIGTSSGNLTELEK